MKKIWVVNGATGVVEGTGLVANDADMSLHVLSGSLIVEVLPSNDTQIWQNNTWTERPAQPSDNHVWVNGAWRLDEQLIAATLRRRRDYLLVKSDWTQLPNGPFTNEQQSAWATYRQALRDITAQPGYPLHVDWPVAPQ